MDLPLVEPALSRAWLRAQGLWHGLPQLSREALRKSPGWLWLRTRGTVIGFIRVVSWGYREVHRSERREAIKAMTDPDKKAVELKRCESECRTRMILWTAIGLIALAAHLYVWYLQPAYRPLVGLELLGLIAGLERIGALADPEQRDEARRGALHHGVSIRALRRDLVAGANARKVADLEVTDLQINRFGWTGRLHTAAPIDDKLIDHLARWLHAPPNSILYQTAKENSANHPFTLLLTDPLAAAIPIPDVNDRHSIRNPARLGRHLFGAPLLLNILRTHIGIIGRTRSGKSSTLNAIIDWIDSCDDAELDGIDLSNAATLGWWRNRFRRRAYDLPGAHAIIDEALALANARNTELNHLAETSEVDDLDDVWIPDERPGRRARYVVIDECHLTPDDPELQAKIKSLIRVSGKTAVNLILATPKPSADDFGSTAIRDSIGLWIMHACASNDVTMVLGSKAISEGWVPYKLVQAQGTDPHDAGKAFIHDGDHRDPEPVRFTRLEPNDCRARARQRSARVAAQVPEAEPTMPQTLRLLVDLTQAQPKVPTDTVITESAHYGLVGLNPDALAAEVRVWGIRPGQLGSGRTWSGNPRGYTRASVQAGLERWRAAANRGADRP